MSNQESLPFCRELHWASTALLAIRPDNQAQILKLSDGCPYTAWFKTRLLLQSVESVQAQS